MSALSVTQMHAACEALCASDADLAKAYGVTGLPVWRHAEPVYATLARTIVYQQISTKAAASIWARLLDWSDGRLNASNVLSASEEELRACGLSGPKIRHLTSIAEAVQSGALPLSELHTHSDAEARRRLVAVRGIGPWTADIFLMGALGRMDAFPEADLGLMEALRILQGAEVRLSPRDFRTHAERWRPYRGMAAHLLWGYLNHLRDQRA